MITEEELRQEIDFLALQVIAISNDQSVDFQTTLDQLRKKIMEMEILAVDFPGIADTIAQIKAHIEEGQRMHDRFTQLERPR